MGHVLRISAVFRLRSDDLLTTYWRAYRQFYTWRNIVRGALAHSGLVPGLRHFAYASGWKKVEPLWDLVIRARQAGAMLPVLEGILSEFGRRPASAFGGQRPDVLPPADVVHGVKFLRQVPRGATDE